jgi:DNA mismatch repair protein MutS2
MRNHRRSRLAWRTHAAHTAPGSEGPAPVPALPSGPAAPARLPPLDLLHAAPLPNVDGGLGEALEFAFAGGDVEDVVRKVLEASPLAPSSWDPSCFADGLFVDTMVRETMGVELDGWKAPIDVPFLVRLLTHPPADPADATLRRGLLAVLVDSESSRGQLGRVYQRLCRLRYLLVTGQTGSREDSTRRRVDTLAAVRDAIEELRGAPAGVHVCLDRLREFAEALAQTEGWARLVELLELEDGFARVAIRMRVGADGRVRGFAVTALEEQTESRFYTSPVRRALTRFGLWLRGVRVGENELVDRWIDHVFSGVADALPPLLVAIGHLEFYLASLALRDRCRREGLEMCLPELREDGGRALEGLFNPLLFAQGVVPVPTDLRTDRFDRLTVITGPNSGGKTRLLQAIGLTQLLAQAGSFVPARSAVLREASTLFVSLIEEAAADSREGRLGTELLRIRRLFERARPRALVILDELCSGTNPSEGEEIFMLVVTLLRELSPEAFVTTHFLEFAERLSSRGEELELAFLQVELDARQQPTYGFVPGVARTSLAARTAARLGVTRDELEALIRRHRQEP